MAGEHLVEEELHQRVDGDDLAAPFRNQSARQVDEAVEIAGNAHQSGQRQVVVRPLQFEGERQSQIGDEGKGMRRVHRDGCQHGEDFLAEQLLQVTDLVGRQIVGLVDHYILRKQLLAQALPLVLLLELQMLGQRGDLFHLLGRRQPVRALFGQAGAQLPFQAGDAHHVEFIEIVGGDGDEAQPLQQRMVAVARLLQHPHIELQPADLAVHEAGWAPAQGVDIGNGCIGLGELAHLIHRHQNPSPGRRPLRHARPGVRPARWPLCCG